MMLLSVPVIVWGCKSDPSVGPNAGVEAKLVASPARVFVNQAGSEPVSVTAVDDEGRPVPATFTLTPPSDPGITVTVDTSQLLVYNAEGVSVQPTSSSTARYLVAASTFTTSSFTVTSDKGKSITIQVDAVPATLPATFSTTDVAFGDTITITAPANTFFRTSSKVTFAGGLTPRIISVSADSTTISLVPGPNDAGVATITDIGVPYNNTLKFTAPTLTGITTTPAITSFPLTASTTTPPGGGSVTLTSIGDYRFDPTASVSIGGVDAITQGASADSTQLTVAVIPSSDGEVVVSGGSIIGFALPAMPTGVDITASSTITKIPGTDALATAPTIPVGSGISTGFVDAPPFGYAGACDSDLGGPCNLYKIVTTEANQAFDVTLNWNINSDLGLYVLDAAGAFFPGAGSADAGGSAATGHPEVGTLTFATPGTYYLAVVSFSAADPAWYSLQITGH